MAKYADYVKKNEELESEIQDAAQNSQDRQVAGNPGFELPERFKDKPLEEVAKAYVELEKAYSRQGNDLGKMRQAMDEYLALQSPQQSEAPTKQEPITIDSLYDDTEGAIQRGVEKYAGDRIKTLEAELARAKLETRVQSLSEKYEGWEQTVQSPEFQNWVMESSYRQRLAQAADKWDLDAAEDLLGMYNDVRGVNSTQAKAERDRALRDATLETGAASVPAQEQVFSRTGLTAMRVKAMQGDREAKAFLQKNAEAIAIAYESGNITD